MANMKMKRHYPKLSALKERFSPPILRRKRKHVVKLDSDSSSFELLEPKSEIINNCSELNFRGTAVTALTDSGIGHVVLETHFCKPHIKKEPVDNVSSSVNTEDYHNITLETVHESPSVSDITVKIICQDVKLHCEKAKAPTNNSLKQKSTKDCFVYLKRLSQDVIHQYCDRAPTTLVTNLEGNEEEESFQEYLDFLMDEWSTEDDDDRDANFTPSRCTSTKWEGQTRKKRNSAKRSKKNTSIGKARIKMMPKRKNNDGIVLIKNLCQENLRSPTSCIEDYSNTNINSILANKPNTDLGNLTNIKHKNPNLIGKDKIVPRFLLPKIISEVNDRPVFSAEPKYKTTGCALKKLCPITKNPLPNTKKPVHPSTLKPILPKPHFDVASSQTQIKGALPLPQELSIKPVNSEFNITSKETPKLVTTPEQPSSEKKEVPIGSVNVEGNYYSLVLRPVKKPSTFDIPQTSMATILSSLTGIIGLRPKSVLKTSQPIIQPALTNSSFKVDEVATRLKSDSQNIPRTIRVSSVKRLNSVIVHNVQSPKMLNNNMLSTSAGRLNNGYTHPMITSNLANDGLKPKISHEARSLNKIIPGTQPQPNNLNLKTPFDCFPFSTENKIISSTQSQLCGLNQKTTFDCLSLCTESKIISSTQPQLKVLNQKATLEGLSLANKNTSISIVGPTQITVTAGSQMSTSQIYSASNAGNPTFRPTHSVIASNFHTQTHPSINQPIIPCSTVLQCANPMMPNPPIISSNPQIFVPISSTNSIYEPSNCPPVSMVTVQPTNSLSQNTMVTGIQGLHNLVIDNIFAQTLNIPVKSQPLNFFPNRGRPAEKIVFNSAPNLAIIPPINQTYKERKYLATNTEEVIKRVLTDRVKHNNNPSDNSEKTDSFIRPSFTDSLQRIAPKPGFKKNSQGSNSQYSSPIKMVDKLVTSTTSGMPGAVSSYIKILPKLKNPLLKNSQQK